MSGNSMALIPEPPLLVLPGLAQAIGLNEAIVLQQLHYWLIKSGHNHEGRKWIYNSYPEWQKQFPFWSVRTIRRAFDNLETEGLVISSNFNKAKFDKTKWYTIDYDKVPCVPAENINARKPSNDRYGHFGQAMCPRCPDDVVNMDRPIPETTTETTTSDGVVSSSLMDDNIESNRDLCDFSKKRKNHDASQKSDFSDEKESRITRVPKPKERFVSYKRQLQPKELEAFTLVADSMEKVVGKTLMELVKQSPESVCAAHAETVERDITHFSYFTKVFFTHLKEENGNGKKTVGTFVDYDDIDKELYL